LKPARQVIETLLLAIVIFLLLRLLVQNFRVDGASMQPTLQSGQYLLVNKVLYFNVKTSTIRKFIPFVDHSNKGHTIYFFHAPHRGEVVVFRFPRDPSRDFIKRVVGLPGETIELRQGVLYINGEAMDEKYLKDKGDVNMALRVIPQGQYFLLGDNRTNSSDSRSWGPVPHQNIVGKASFRYWPFSKFGFISSPKVNPLGLLGWLAPGWAG
jgi:signal peptidase I